MEQSEIQFLNQVISEPESYLDEERMNFLEKLVEKYEDCNSEDEVCAKVEEAVNVTSEVVFLQLQKLVKEMQDELALDNSN